MAYDRDRYDPARYEHDRFERDRPDRDRGALSRAGDEVRSWFGDDEAHRRRERDTFATSRHPSYTRSQEFGPEGYGAVGRYGTARGYGREWGSTERWRVPGPFVGRGPKGYQRSDDRIREDVSERLMAHGLIDASDIEVRVQAGEVTLTGYVDSRDAKRAAEDCADDISGVREVHNQLRIRTHAEDVGARRTSVLGLTEQETQTIDVARRGDAPTTSRAR
jgi:hypothetical protein